MKLRLHKYQAAGNDFLLTEDDVGGAPGVLAQELCRRRFSAGADGLAVLTDCRGAEPTLRVFRPDGNEYGVDLGAALCAAAYLSDGNGIVRLKTAGGVIKLLTESMPQGCRVTADAGKASFLSGDVGAVCAEPVIDRKTELGNRILRLTAVHAGISCAVCFIGSIEDTNMAYLGEKIVTSALFRKGADAVFAETVDGGRLRVRSFERGIGGIGYGITAAAAAVAAACRLEKCRTGTELCVETAGGLLSAACARDNTIMVAAEVTALMQSLL